MLLKATLILWILVIVSRVLAKGSLRNESDINKLVGHYSISTCIFLILHALLALAAVIVTIITIIKW